MPNTAISVAARPTRMRRLREPRCTTRGIASSLPKMALKSRTGAPLGGGRAPAALRVDFVPPARQLRSLPLREGERREFGERARVDRALEVDDLAYRLPPARPAPAVELGLIGPPEIEPHVIIRELQKKPALLLPDAQRLLVAADEARRQAVAQPPGGRADELDARAFDADLLGELAEDRLLGGLPLAHTALGKLPASAAG